MLFIFLIIGLITGLFYGWNDYRIYFYPHTNKFYKKGIPPVNLPAKINAIWIHLVCGFVGAIALYLISIKLISDYPNKIVGALAWQDFVVLLIGLLGITGLLPRTLWFFASKADIPDLIKK